MASNKPIHILRYGTVAEKIHLEKALSAYDYLAINGNTAAFVSNAIARFVVEKFFSHPEKGYFIDPITYAFQNKIELLRSKSKSSGQVSIKKSVEKLIEKYGYPVDKVRNGSAITPNDFSTKDEKDTFTERVLSFQYNLVYEHVNDNELQKYLEYVSPSRSTEFLQLRPKFLIAPYFYLDSQESNWEEWLDLNCQLAEVAVRMSEANYHLPIFAQIVLNKSILNNRAFLQNVVERYSKLQCTGFTIWVDDLNEHEASMDELTGFVMLLKGLNQKPIYNMYGGYLSILFTHKSLGLLSGVSHGLEYGESRMVYPVGGGIPVSKYYFMPVHQRLDFTKAFYLLEHTNVIDTTQENWGSSDVYYKTICRCSQCQKIISDEMINFVEFESREFYEIHRRDHVLRRKKASSDTKENCLYHYLLCKKIEFSKIRTQSLSALLSELDHNQPLYQDCEYLKNGELDYLDNWNKICKLAGVK